MFKNARKSDVRQDTFPLARSTLCSDKRPGLVCVVERNFWADCFGWSHAALICLYISLVALLAAVQKLAPAENHAGSLNLSALLTIDGTMVRTCRNDIAQAFTRRLISIAVTPGSYIPILTTSAPPEQGLEQRNESKSMGKTLEFGQNLDGLHSESKEKWVPLYPWYPCRLETLL